jgi:hypothetical protein
VTLSAATVEEDPYANYAATKGSSLAVTVFLIQMRGNCTSPACCLSGHTCHSLLYVCIPTTIGHRFCQLAALYPLTGPIYQLLVSYVTSAFGTQPSLPNTPRSSKPSSCSNETHTLLCA